MSLNAIAIPAAREPGPLVTRCRGAKWPKAVAKITNDLDVLLAFYDFPGQRTFPNQRTIERGCLQ